MKVKSLSRVRLLVTPWTAAHQTPPSVGFARQEYWSGVPLPALQEDSLPAELPGKSMELLSSVQFFATLGTVARQSSLPMGFSSQEYWSGLPFPFPMHESEK